MSTRILIASLLLATSAFAQSTAKAPPSEAAHYPNLIHADLPLYPPLARTAHVNGTVEIQVTVERGAVVDAQVKSSSSPLLSTSAVANVKTWQFQSEDRTTFPVTYVYQIEGEQTPLPENPKVELDLPRLVKVTARPFKPSCSDCGAQNHGGGPAAIDPKDGSVHLQIPILKPSRRFQCSLHQAKSASTKSCWNPTSRDGAESGSLRRKYRPECSEKAFATGTQSIRKRGLQPTRSHPPGNIESSPGRAAASCRRRTKKARGRTQEKVPAGWQERLCSVTAGLLTKNGENSQEASRA